MGKWILISFIFFINFGHSNAQREATTLSGQKVKIFADGMWEKVLPIEQTLDSNGLIINELNPKSLPPTNTLDDTNKEMIDKLISTAEQREVETFLLLDQLDKDLAINQVATSQSELTKDKVKLKALKSELKLLKNKIEEANESYRLSSKNIATIKNIQNLKAKDQKEKIMDFAVMYKLNSTDDEVKPIQSSNNKNMEASRLQNKISESKTNCKIAYDKKEKKVRHIATESSYIFGYTPEKLKSYFKEKELMTVTSHLERIGKQHHLVLTVKIISKDAARNYGMIQKENMLKVTFITGKSVTLHALDDVRATIETYTGNSVYSINYSIPSEDIDSFAKIPLDTVGIMWSSGFESYDIYEVDILLNHFACIKSVQ